MNRCCDLDMVTALFTACKRLLSPQRPLLPPILRNTKYKTHKMEPIVLTMLFVALGGVLYAVGAGMRPRVKAVAEATCDFGPYTVFDVAAAWEAYPQWRRKITAVAPARDGTEEDAVAWVERPAGHQWRVAEARRPQSLRLEGTTGSMFMGLHFEVIAATMKQGHCTVRVTHTLRTENPLKRVAVWLLFRQQALVNQLVADLGKRLREMDLARSE